MGFLLGFRCNGAHYAAPGFQHKSSHLAIARSLPTAKGVLQGFQDIKVGITDRSDAPRGRDKYDEILCFHSPAKSHHPVLFSMIIAVIEKHKIAFGPFTDQISRTSSRVRDTIDVFPLYLPVSVPHVTVGRPTLVSFCSAELPCPVHDFVSSVWGSNFA